jgi:hypothetical protein
MRAMEGDAETAPYLPFDGEPYRPSMGLRTLAPADWIDLRGDLAGELARKRALMESRHDEVFAALPQADGAAQELLALLVAHLVRHHPALFGASDDRLLNRATGERWDSTSAALHPLELAGRLVPEDFCILLRDAATHRLVAASLCSPSRWRLSEKLGQPMGAIHDPVPAYAERLAAPVDRFLAALQPDRLVWRLNWFIHDDPARFQPVRRPSAAAIGEDSVGERLYLRVERQTLRRLPGSDAVIFTIRTYLTPLGRAIATPRAAADLAATIRSMPDPVRAYRQIEDFETSLLTWLDARA